MYVVSKCLGLAAILSNRVNTAFDPCTSLGVAKCALPIAYGWLSSSFVFLLLLLLDHSLRKVSQAARLLLRPLRQA